MKTAVRYLFIVACGVMAAHGKSSAQLGPTGPTVKPTVTPQGLQREVLRIGYPPAPIPVTPADNLTTSDGRMTFNWRHGQGTPQATSFKICVRGEGVSCENPGQERVFVFPLLAFQPITGTSYTPIGGLGIEFQGRKLWWSVMACAPLETSVRLPGTSPREGCTSSVPRRLTWALPAPRLEEPGPGASVPTLRPTFRWRMDSLQGVDHFLFCISRPGVACHAQPAATTDTVVTEVRGATSYTPRSDLALLRQGQLHWTVAACNAALGCNYQQAVRGIAVALPAAPGLLNPADGRMFAKPLEQFGWAPVSGVTSYKFCVSRPGVGCGTGDSYVRHVGSSPAYSMPVNDVARFGPGQTVNWTAAACGDGGCTWQQAVRRITTPPAPAAGPTLLEPEDGKVFHPTYERLGWSSVPGATGYKYCISRPGVACGTGDSIESQPFNGLWTLLWNSAVRRFAGHGVFAGQTAHWTVAACNEMGCTYQQRVRALTIPPLPGAPSLLEPADGHTFSNPQRFRWSAWPLATSYELCISRDASAADGKIGTSYTAGQELRPGGTPVPYCSGGNSVVIKKSTPLPSAWVDQSVGFDQVRAFAGQTVFWSVAACNSMGCSYLYQQPVRRITIP